jgi:hypothetical protein
MDTTDTNDKDIRELFERVSEHFKDADDSSKAMFSMLVDTTLKYRDMLHHSSGHTLTVEQTRLALSTFMGVLKTHDVPKDLDPLTHDLVIMWLEGLKAQKQN